VMNQIRLEFGGFSFLFFLLFPLTGFLLTRRRKAGFTTSSPIHFAILVASVVEGHYSQFLGGMVAGGCNGGRKEGRMAGSGGSGCWGMCV